MWINSAGIPGILINNLFSDCRDGLVLLHVIDHVEPGTVDWNEVDRKPSNKFKCVSNCNQVMVACKKLRFSLVGIAGSDIYDMHHTFLLAIAWQLMRLHIFKHLQNIQTAKFGHKAINDALIVGWANNRVATKLYPFLTEHNTKFNEVVHNIKSLQAASLSNSLFLLNLLWAVEARVVNWKLVTHGRTEEEKLLNARYAVSVARKLGATIFLLPEDIVEVKPKMMLTFIASIMSCDSD